MRQNGGLMTTPCAIAERRTILNVLNELSAFAPAGLENALYAAKLAAQKTESRRKTSLGEALLKREALDDPKTSSPPALQIRNGQGSLL